MTSPENDVSKPCNPGYYLNCAVNSAMYRSENREWEGKVDMSDLTSLRWAFMTYDYLFDSVRIEPSSLYPVMNMPCPACKHKFDIKLEDVWTTTCPYCLTCFFHSRVDCVDQNCTDVEQFKMSMNYILISDETRRNALLAPFSGFVEWHGDCLVFKRRQGIVIAQTGKIPELSAAGLLEDGRLAAVQKERILRFASSLLPVSEQGQTLDGQRTHFLRDGNNENSSIFFMLCDVNLKDYEAFSDEKFGGKPTEIHPK